MGYLQQATEELYRYMPSLTKRDDFDDFWRETIDEAKKVPLAAKRTRVDYPIRRANIYEIQYDGLDGTPIHGWMLVPDVGVGGPLPCLIRYHGFNGSRSEPSAFMHWVLMGFVVISVDCRDQGGRTGNHASYSSGFSMNVASKGVHNRYEYYYRYVYMDCLKAIDFACEQTEVDRSRIVVEGGSQGGGLAMAVAALDDRPVLALADVPSNSNLTKRVEGQHGAFASVAEYIKKHPSELDLVLDNLSYFDTMNMADRIACRVYASVAMKDDTCPPQMYFATYNRIAGEKDIAIYPFNGHEGGGPVHTEKKIAYVHRWFGDWFA
ncbi:acetylxylan esterase [Cohnella hashimotonis]|uniref:Acetylxylan esterase n=1 Tax=Cohnella hashimotonis TaxID=2826895 RepID=A0ABT6TE93_9BACL|nr:acetylxylan esterase [Cohnella hashimotonis]MDI4645154.1 acetylxylan esterase [Cohnella hashimotonis]